MSNAIRTRYGADVWLLLMLHLLAYGCIGFLLALRVLPFQAPVLAATIGGITLLSWAG
ncbi:hypothetical protein H6F43_20060, partial [Leptolyngbya sp. FACHB-36]|nr:hypothetical protein [Leptolyngbya sp. FACHB-36]